MDEQHTLVCNIGNTNTYYAEKIEQKSYIFNVCSSSYNALENLLRNKSYTLIIILSVVPSLTIKAQQICQKFAIPTYVFNPQQLDLSIIGLQSHTQLGHDRICNILGAVRDKNNSIYLIISAGSALCVDVVACLQGKSNYLGGSITAGMGMQMQALQNNTALLPIVPLKYHDTLLQCSTISQIQSGIVTLISYGLTILYNQLQAQYHNIAIKTYITGGDGQYIQLNNKNAVYNPNLWLEGLKHYMHQQKITRS